MHVFILAVSFGEMDLSPFTYYGLIFIGIVFIICFGLASIPLAQNLQKTKKVEKKDLIK